MKQPRDKLGRFSSNVPKSKRIKYSASDMLDAYKYGVNDTGQYMTAAQKRKRFAEKFGLDLDWL
jgi:hypothetical protein